MFPFFRDREELPTSSNLGDNLQEALRRSRYLIVVCSPHAAASRWVNEEVRQFKALGREDRILCLIVAGEPHASDKPDCGTEECFPPTVRFRAATDGRLSDQPIEPLAADVRPGRDSKPDAKLKLLAGLLGIGFDELKQRDRQRVLRARIQWTFCVTGMLLMVLGICGWQLQLLRAQARREQIASLTESGRRELLDGHPRESAVYLSEAYRLGGTDLPLRLMLSRVLPPLETEIATLKGHAAAVNFAVFSPDGKRILTGSDDGLAKVWNAQTRELVATLAGHKWFVRSGGFAAGGRSVFTVGSEDVAKLWDAGSGALLATLDGERATLSPDGQLLATAKDGQALVWDVASGKLLQTLEGQSLHLAAIAFHPSGKQIAGGGGLDAAPAVRSRSPRGRIWDVSTGKVVAYLIGHGGAINSVAYSQDGTQLVTTGVDGAAIVWDAASGAQVNAQNASESVSFAEFKPNGQQHFTVTANVVTLWDAARPENPAAELVHDAWVQSARYSSDGRRILTAANDDTAYLWDAATGQQLLALRGHAGPIQTAEFSPDDRIAVTASADHSVKLWELGRLPVQAMFAVDGISAIAFHPSGQQLACAGARVEIWDVRKGTRIQSIDAHSAWGVRDVGFSPDGNRVVTASEDRSCKVWNLPSEALVSTFDGHDARVMSARFSSDGRRVVSAGLDHSAKIWNAATGELVRSLPLSTGQPTCAAFTPNGEQVFVAAGRTTEIWNVATGDLKLKLAEQSTAPAHAAISTSGSRIVTTDGEDANLWDTSSGKLVARMTGHQAHINRIAFSGDGSLVATAGNDGTIRIWDAESAKQLLLIDGCTSEVIAVDFSPDQESIAFALAGGTVQVWKIPQEHRHAEAVCEIVKRRVPLNMAQRRLLPR